MMLAFPLISLCAAVIPVDISYDDYLTRFISSKHYVDDEKLRRRTIFSANVEKINKQNADFENGLSSWAAGINEFSDWTLEEFRARRTATLPSSQRHIKMNALLDVAASVDDSPTPSDLPESVDWRAHADVLTPVKNQGGCGSCWAFSAVETFEAALSLSSGKASPALSTQQIVSCSPNPLDCGGTGGCQGSTQQLAFNYSMTAGITTEADYPYRGVTGTCEPDKIKPVAKNAGFTTVMPNNYTDLVHNVAQRPIAVTVAAGGLGWQLYSHGVYSGGIAGCGFELDHGVQLVGYGEDNGEKYWIIRNSWGKSWGQKGFMYLARYGEGQEPCGVDKRPADGIACKGDTTKQTWCGECGILASSSYPLNVKAL
jgi:cathepsin L